MFCLEIYFPGLVAMRMVLLALVVLCCDVMCLIVRGAPVHGVRINDPLLCQVHVMLVLCQGCSAISIQRQPKNKTQTPSTQPTPRP